MKYSLNIVVIIMIAGFLLVNFPILGIAEAAVQRIGLPALFLYIYGCWALLIMIYFFLFRKAGE